MLSSVQSLSHVQLFATPWTAARQASLFIANSQSLLKPMSIESVMPSNHLILCCPLLLLPPSFPASGSFPKSWLFSSGGQSTGVSASVSVLPMNIQDRFPTPLFKSINASVLQGIFLGAAGGGYSLAAGRRLLPRRLLLLWSTALGLGASAAVAPGSRARLSSCGSQA